METGIYSLLCRMGRLEEGGQKLKQLNSLRGERCPLYNIRYIFFFFLFPEFDFYSETTSGILFKKYSVILVGYLFKMNCA